MVAGSEAQHWRRAVGVCVCVGVGVWRGWGADGCGWCGNVNLYVLHTRWVHGMKEEEHILAGRGLGSVRCDQGFRVLGFGLGFRV